MQSPKSNKSVVYFHRPLVTRYVMRVTLIILTVVLVNFAFAQTSKQTLFLHKGKKKVEIRFGWIGLVTKTDTIKYFGAKDLSFEIFNITPDSLTLRAPVEYHYDLITWDKPRPSDTTKHDRRYLKSFKTNKVRYTAYIIVDKFDYRSYSFKNIISIQYPPEGSNQTGCMGCIILPIIPIANVWFYYEMRKRWHPKNYNLSEWTVKVD
jgi:hypothetical protein